MVQDYDRPLETDFLLVIGVFMIILGLLLLASGAGRVALNENGAYGLSLVLFGFDAMTIGKTPFADVRRSWALVLAGLGVAALGMFACFIPHVLTQVARVCVGVMLLGGGLARLLQLVFAKDQARAWMRAGGALARMTAASTLAYLLRMAAGVVVLAPGRLDLRWASAVFVALGFSLLYAASALRRVSTAFPAATRQDPGRGRGWLDDPELPLSLANLLLMGILLILLGVLLFPVGFGLLPYSPDGQLGLMLVLMAIQAMALGATPLGEVKRPVFMLAIGLMFAALGIVASIVPGLLTGWLRLLIGVLNVGGGLKLLLDTHRRSTSKPPGAAHPPPAVGALSATVTAVGALNVVFGVASLVPSLLPVSVMAVLLVLMGFALLRLASLLRTRALMPSNPA